MASILPFDPAFRRTPRHLRALRAADGPSYGPTRRQTPIPRRAARAVAGGVAAHAALAGSRLDERALAGRFFPLALAVVCLDLATKLAAGALLADGAPRPALGPFSLHLVYNAGSAGGLMLGAHTRALNLVATGLVVGLLVMLVPALARVDRRSTTALALVAGGGLGNLVSLATSARGVEDFLAWRYGAGAVVLNVADLAMFAGLALLGRTLWALAQAVRTHGPAARVGRLATR
jgi:signal peptidase II